MLRLLERESDENRLRAKEREQTTAHKRRDRLFFLNIPFSFFSLYRGNDMKIDEKQIEIMGVDTRHYTHTARAVAE